MKGLLRVGVFSDSHGDTLALKTALQKAGVLDAACFLGDYAQDAQVIANEGIPVCVVRGNNDFDSNAADETVIELGGVRIFCTHGHRYGVYFGLDKLYYRALEQGAEVALFGHTHRPLMDKNGSVLILNPGSVAEARGGDETFAVLEIKDGKVEPFIRYVFK